MKKTLALLSLTGLMVVNSFTAAFAYEEMVQDSLGNWYTRNGIEQEVWVQDEHGWFRQTNSVVMGPQTVKLYGWHWIDGNYDGVGECYYFGENHYILTDTVTPDGYTVNTDGAWIENGVVQTVGQNINDYYNKIKQMDELKSEKNWKILEQYAEGDKIVIRKSDGSIWQTYSRAELEASPMRVDAITSLIGSMDYLDAYYGK